jgi:hypothetical protein
VNILPLLDTVDMGYYSYRAGDVHVDVEAQCYESCWSQRRRCFGRSSAETALVGPGSCRASEQGEDGKEKVLLGEETVAEARSTIGRQRWGLVGGRREARSTCIG